MDSWLVAVGASFHFHVGYSVGRAGREREDV